MNAIVIDKDLVRWEGQRSSLFAEHGLRIKVISPAAISAFTSLKLRRIIDNNHLDLVIVFSVKDAMAAISARSLSTNPKLRIAYLVKPNSNVPRGIPGDVRHGIDSWVFPNERLLKAYPQDLRKMIELGVADIDNNIEGMCINPQLTNPLSYAWIGPIDGNTQRLIEAIDAIDKASEGATLDICGTGKAQMVMPAVRHARAINHPTRIIWHGDGADAAGILSHCACVVQSSTDIEALEMGAAVLGLTIATPAHINGNKSDGGVIPLSRHTYASALCNHFESLCQ